MNFHLWNPFDHLTVVVLVITVVLTVLFTDIVDPATTKNAPCSYNDSSFLFPLHLFCPVDKHEKVQSVFYVIDNPILFCGISHGMVFLLLLLWNPTNKLTEINTIDSGVVVWWSLRTTGFSGSSCFRMGEGVSYLYTQWIHFFSCLRESFVQTITEWTLIWTLGINGGNGRYQHLSRFPITFHCRVIATSLVLPFEVR